MACEFSVFLLATNIFHLKTSSFLRNVSSSVLPENLRNGQTF